MSSSPATSSGPKLGDDPAFDAESNTGRLLAISGSFSAIATMVVFLRVYVRFRMIKHVGPDDFVIFLGLIFALANQACFILKKDYGMGKHTHTITLEMNKTYRHIGFFQSQSFVLGVCCVKISVAFLLMRLAAMTKIKKFLWGVIIFMILFTIACLGTLIFNCSPISGAWDPAVRAAGKCYSMATFRNIGLFNTCVNVITDILFATLPLPLIWKLQTNRRTRVSLGVILSLGYFACAAGLVKGVKQANFLKIKDASFWEEIQLWGFIQLQVGIIAACIPTLKPLFRFILEKTKAMTSGGYGGGNGSRSGGRTPHGTGLNHSSSKANKKARQTSIQLPPYPGAKGHHYDGTYDVRISIEQTHGESSLGMSPKNSEEDILPKKPWTHGEVKNGGITRTTEVIISSASDHGGNRERERDGERFGGPGGKRGSDSSGLSEKFRVGKGL